MEQIWSAIIAATIAIIAMFVNNSFSLKRQKEEQIHLSNENKINLKKNMKKEIYLNVLEEITDIKTYLGMLPNMSQLDFQKNSDYLASKNIYKANLIATTETLEKLSRLTTYYYNGIFNIISEKIVLDKINSNINANKPILEDYNIKRKKILQDMEQFNLDKRTDKIYFQTLQSNFDFVSKELEKYNEENSKLYFNAVQEKNKLLLECLNIVSDGLDLEIEAVIGLRNELELDLQVNIDSYKQQLISDNNLLRETIKKTMEKVM